MARTASGTAAKRWQELLDRWRSSGLSVRRFCEREQVSEPSFYLWRKRLQAVTEREPGLGVNAPLFVPVRVVDEGPRTFPSLTHKTDDPAIAARHVEIVLPSGVMIRIAAHTDEERLRHVLRAVVAETRGC